MNYRILLSYLLKCVFDRALCVCSSEERSRGGVTKELPQL